MLTDQGCAYEQTSCLSRGGRLDDASWVLEISAIFQRRLHIVGQDDSWQLFRCMRRDLPNAGRGKAQ